VGKPWLTSPNKGLYLAKKILGERLDGTPQDERKGKGDWKKKKA